MILRRYLLREVGLNFLGVGLLFSLIFLSSTFIRLLTEAMEGKFPTGILFTLFSLKGVGNLVFILPLAFFLGVMLAFGRLYKDSEMAIFFACGVRPGQILQMISSLAIIVTLLISFLSLYFAPWAEEQSSQLLDEASARTDVGGILPGQFNQFGVRGPVVYAEGMESGTKTLTGVFAQFREQGQEMQLIAARAREAEQQGGRYLLLLDGYRYVGQPGMPEYRVIRFREHGILLREQAIVSSSRPRYAIPTSKLIGSADPGDKAELQWRLATPLSALLLGLLAVPLSKTSPRHGRFGGLFLGIILYVVYNNLLTVARSSVGNGEIPAWLGMWWVHGLLLLILTGIIWRQNHLKAPRQKSRMAS